MDTIPDPEVRERPVRRRFAAAYKLAILDELDHATAPGAKGAILRREGLYSSHVTEWRRLRVLGGLEALALPRQTTRAEAPRHRAVRGCIACDTSDKEGRLRQLFRSWSKRQCMTFTSHTR